MEIFAKRLKELRLEKGLSQKALAKLINVSDGAIAKWELAKRSITIENIIAIAKIFDVTADYLLGLSDY